MALFAVIALKDSGPGVDEALSKVPSDSSYKIEAGKWLVNTEVTTARELSIKLGLRETQTHIIFSVRGYSGRAQPDMWEWLAAQSAKADG
jgi:hypothetical protein